MASKNNILAIVSMIPDKGEFRSVGKTLLQWLQPFEGNVEFFEVKKSESLNRQYRFRVTLE
jgi:hypothetical protein